jgi:phage/plasmid-like protein (TIGR03299 family)
MVAAVETMAYVGEVPWHGLGNKVEEGIDLDDFRRSAGLDWEVSKRPVAYQNISISGSAIFKDKFVLARNTDDRPYAVVSGRYKPVQPKQVFEFFRELLNQHGMKMHTAGSLNDGAKIWALATTGDSAFIRGLDQVKAHLLLCTSYDLTLSTTAQFVSERVVCNNTLNIALKESGGGKIVIPHLRDFDADAVKDEMGIGREQWGAFTATLDVLAKTKINVDIAAQVMSTVFKLPEDVTVPNSDRIHARNVINLFSDERFKGADLAGQTAWGLLNATTEYVDWHKRARNQNNRINSAWFGEGANLKAATFNELVKVTA